MGMRPPLSAAIRQQLRPSSRASTSKWTIESDIAFEEERERRVPSHSKLCAGPQRRDWIHHRTRSAARSMSMHTSARRASGVPEDRLVQYAESPPAYGMHLRIPRASVSPKLGS